MNKTLVFACALALGASIIPLTATASVTAEQRAADARAQDAMPQRAKTALGMPVHVMENFAAAHAAPRIIENGQAPLHDYHYVFLNQFDGVVGSEIVNVYAGYYRFRPTQGVYMVMRSSLDLSRSTVPQLVNGPAGMGALRVAKYEGGQLTLKSERGPTALVRLR